MVDPENKTDIFESPQNISYTEDPAWIARLKQPEYSEWKCYLFGSTADSNGFIFQPRKGYEPNRFVRWMMKFCFACTWVKEEK